MKIAGFLFDNHIPFELILDPKANLERYEHVFMSRVFTFTNLPEFYTKAIGTSDEAKFHIGGTGFYANETSIREYRKKREEDFFRLDYDAYLNTFINHRGGHKDRGIDMARVLSAARKLSSHKYMYGRTNRPFSSRSLSRNHSSFEYRQTRFSSLLIQNGQ